MRDDTLLEKIEADFVGAHREGLLSDQRLAMLQYASKLTLTPQAMRESDVVELRAVGWSDRDILEIAEVTAYYAYVNRIADGLGVQLEESDDH